MKRVTNREALFRDEEEFFTAQEADRQMSYAGRVLFKLVEVMEGKERARYMKRERGKLNEFTFAWFNDSFGFSVALEARKIRKFDLLSLFSRFTKTEMWKTYGEVYDLLKYLKKPVGMIFPAYKLSNWIIHDCKFGLGAQGYTRITRIVPNGQVVIEPFKCFLESVITGSTIV